MKHPSIFRWLRFTPILCLISLVSSCVQDTAKVPPQQKSNSTATSDAWQGEKVVTDVLVIGGTPSGVAAAIAAARQGARVVLVEEHAELGGDMNYAMLNMFDVPMREDGTSPVAVGIFGEIFKPLGIAFDISTAQTLLEQKVRAEPNILLWKRASVSHIWKLSGGIEGALVESVEDSSLEAGGMPAPQTGVEAKVVVDATNDADFAAWAGARFKIGREAGGLDAKQQSVSLLFSVKGADWDAMKAYVRGVELMPAARRIGQEYASDVAPTSSKEVPATTAQNSPRKLIKHRLGGVDGNYIWERGDVVSKYKSHNPAVLALSINFGRQGDGTIILNTLNAVGVNGLSDADKERARQEMSAEIAEFIPYLRHSMPGLEKIELGQVASELYIRETRHLQGLYELQTKDVVGQRQFPDRIALASYPLDLHPYAIGQTNPFGPKRYYYTLPLRSLVPSNIDGLFVASRCLSASYEASGSARVIPVTMAAGEACGVAAAFAARRGLTPRQIAQNKEQYKHVQELLRISGADVGDVFPTR